MLTAEENELLTRVEGDAPMGRLMRGHYWIPFLRAAALEAGGAPQRVRLFGRDYVAFRASDGRVGFFNEACPHRRASLVLARNEDCALRCIFHGWKFDVSGQVIEAPTETVVPQEAFVRNVRLEHYPTREAGGLLWVWLGSGEAPDFPKLPWFGIANENMWLTRTVTHCNWLQGVEGSLDSSHIGQLHHTWISNMVRNPPPEGGGSRSEVLSVPSYEVARAPYGLRAAALRPAGDEVYARVTEYYMPFVCLVPKSGPKEGNIFISVPIDDVTHMLFFGEWNWGRPCTPEQGGTIGNGDFDQDNYANFRGDRATNWGQDREAMKAGHFSGFTRNLLEEDVVVQVSMGPIADRTQEHLSSSDVAIGAARRLLLSALREVEAGGRPPGSVLDVAPVLPAPLNAMLRPDQSWKTFAHEPA